MNLFTRSMLAIVLIIGIIAVLVGLYIVSGAANRPLIFSPADVLGATWLEYKSQYVQADTSRTVDPSRGNITTSEGESYTMLRAVWMDDKQTFDASWGWTEQNLQHPKDALFSWVYGPLGNGSYGIVTNMNGNTTASDGDEDIALALVFAYARWNDPSYLASARSIMGAIWNNEVVTIDGTPYLAADNLEKNAKTSYIVVDPSYLAPEDYRVFALVDPTHPWNELVDSSYSVIEQSMQEPLDRSKSVDLPPDWISINRTTGAIGAPPVSAAATNASATSTAQTTDFGFDALRVPFRLALDYSWSQDPRDTELLAQMSFLKYTWESAHAIGETYGHDGTPVMPAQALSMYGGTIGYFFYEDPADGKTIYEEKLAPLFDPESNEWTNDLSYYDSNWLWFGIALYNGLLPNLADNAVFPSGT